MVTLALKHYRIPNDSGNKSRGGQIMLCSPHSTRQINKIMCTNPKQRNPHRELLRFGLRFNCQLYSWLWYLVKEFVCRVPTFYLEMHLCLLAITTHREHVDYLEIHIYVQHRTLALLMLLLLLLIPIGLFHQPSSNKPPPFLRNTECTRFWF